jgi:hypothetical protein
MHFLTFLLMDLHAILVSHNYGTFCDQVSRLPQGGLQLERSSQQTHPACYEPEMRTGKDQRPREYRNRI